MKRRYLADMYGPVKRHRRATRKFVCFLLAVFFIAAGVFFGGHALFAAFSKAKDGEDAAGPGAAPTVITSAAMPEATEEENDGEARFLFLVNWNHRLPEGRPDGLARLDQMFEGRAIEDDRDGLINETAGRAAAQMFSDAREEGVAEYKINSAYRSQEYQEQLWKKRLREDTSYGKNPFEEPVRVMPGNASEHSTGLAIDILSCAHDRADDDFGDTPEGRWLRDNAWKYGFILRYLQGKEGETGVIYEPWHYRYVGKEAAKEIFESGQCLEEYLETP